MDRVFSRMGATDRLVKGESTFLVEMIETSRILHYATEKSFIIMDEIGRGTSTYDGLSIAWAVLEYLLDESLVGAKVLFATHYHEITALEGSRGVINYNATVKEWNNDVIFLRKIVPGIASKSYGIEVARMAGIPDTIIEKAKSILQKLESEYSSYVPFFSANSEREDQSGKGQLDLFPSSYDIIKKELWEIDINEITPLEALSILDRIKKSINGMSG
jgi:DNA mismatch repair protein MutS